MTETPPLTKYIGEVERSLRAILDQLLEQAGLSFPSWTVVMIVDASGPREASDLIDQQLKAHVVPDATAAQATVDDLIVSGLLARYAMTTEESRQTTASYQGGLALTKGGEAI